MVAKTLNGVVGTETFPNLGVETQGTYFQVVSQNNALVPLKVLVGNDTIAAGSIVYVLKQAQADSWAQPKNTVEFNKSKMIFVPLSEVKVVEVE